MKQKQTFVKVRCKNPKCKNIVEVRYKRKNGQLCYECDIKKYNCNHLSEKERQKALDLFPRTG